MPDLPISDEQLIAYLLGDTTEAQAATIELRLQTDSDLTARLRQLRGLLGLLDATQCAYEPPADLFLRTMASVDASERVFEPPVASEPVRPAKLSTESSRAGSNKQLTWDSLALGVCLALLCCLVLPTILQARFQSRRVQCADNLRELGVGLTSLAMLDPQQRFPHVAVAGPEAFAGIYAVRLNSAGLLKPQQLSCASLNGSDAKPHTLALEDIPQLPELYRLSEIDQKICQRVVGGDYAYNLGLLENERVVAPRLEGREQFAILADAPMMLAGTERFIAHDGKGLNLLFEDGHVAFVRVHDLRQATGDDPFCNLRGAREVGLNKQDASLAPSHFPPLANPNSSFRD